MSLHFISQRARIRHWLRLQYWRLWFRLTALVRP